MFVFVAGLVDEEGRDVHDVDVVAVVDGVVVLVVAFVADVVGVGEKEEGEEDAIVVGGDVQVGGEGKWRKKKKKVYWCLLEEKMPMILRRFVKGW